MESPHSARSVQFSQDITIREFENANGQHEDEDGGESRRHHKKKKKKKDKKESRHRDKKRHRNDHDGFEHEENEDEQDGVNESYGSSGCSDTSQDSCSSPERTVDESSLRKQEREHLSSLVDQMIHEVASNTVSGIQDNTSQDMQSMEDSSHRQGKVMAEALKENTIEEEEGSTTDRPVSPSTSSQVFPPELEKELDVILARQPKLWGWQRAELQRLFGMFDVEKVGRVFVSDAKGIGIALGFHLTSRDLEAIAETGESQGGKVDMNDIERWLANIKESASDLAVERSRASLSPMSTPRRGNLSHRSNRSSPPKSHRSTESAPDHRTVEDVSQVIGDNGVMPSSSLMVRRRSSLASTLGEGELVGRSVEVFYKLRWRNAQVIKATQKTVTLARMTGMPPNRFETFLRDSPMVKGLSATRSALSLKFLAPTSGFDGHEGSIERTGYQQDDKAWRSTRRKVHPTIVRDILRAFDFLNKSKTGTLTEDQVPDLLERLGCSNDFGEIEREVCEKCKGTYGGIHVELFIRWWGESYPGDLLPESPQDAQPEPGDISDILPKLDQGSASRSIRKEGSTRWKQSPGRYDYERGQNVFAFYHGKWRRARVLETVWQAVVVGDIEGCPSSNHDIFLRSSRLLRPAPGLQDDKSSDNFENVSLDFLNDNAENILPQPELKPKSTAKLGKKQQMPLTPGFCNRRKELERAAHVKPAEDPSTSMLGSNLIIIEYCIGCHLHQDTTKHHNQIYANRFKAVAAFFTTMDFHVIGNPKPNGVHLIQTPTKEPFYRDRTTGKFHRYPEIGAFEVYIVNDEGQDYRLFSKLGSKVWPNIEKLLHRAIDIRNGTYDGAWRTGRNRNSLGRGDSRWVYPLTSNKYTIIPPKLDLSALKQQDSEEDQERQ